MANLYIFATFGRKFFAKNFIERGWWVDLQKCTQFKFLRQQEILKLMALLNIFF